MELELKQYVDILGKRKWMIISFVLFTCLISGLLSNYLVKPSYFASTKVIINKSDGDSKLNTLDLSTLNASIQLVNTYKEIIKTPIVLDKVVSEHPEFHITTESLNSKLSVSSKDQSQIMTIGIIDSSPEEASRLVNSVTSTFKREIPNIMKVDNVEILSESKLGIPIGNSRNLYIIITFFASLLISVCMVFLLEHLDDSIRTEAEIEDYLGLPILSTIVASKKSDLKKRNQTFQKVVGEQKYASSGN